MIRSSHFFIFQPSRAADITDNRASVRAGKYFYAVWPGDFALLAGSGLKMTNL